MALEASLYIFYYARHGDRFTVPFTSRMWNLTLSSGKTSVYPSEESGDWVHKSYYRTTPYVK